MQEEDEVTSAPLSQRQSGRQQRRAVRSMKASPVPPEIATEAPIKSSSTTPLPQTPQQRGPSAELERRIADSIAKRQKSNIASAAISAGYEEADYNEILGTYEYLDHTADIQLHSWGDSLSKALEQLALALFGYMTKLSLVEVNDKDTAQFGQTVRVEAHDLTSLVFNFLQEWLCIFHESGFVPRRVTVQSMDLETFVILTCGEGEIMKLEKHVQGTEVKAITYSNLQVIQSDEEDQDRWDIWVILDI